MERLVWHNNYLSSAHNSNPTLAQHTKLENNANKRFPRVIVYPLLLDYTSPSMSLNALAILTGLPNRILPRRDKVVGWLYGSLTLSLSYTSVQPSSCARRPSIRGTPATLRALDILPPLSLLPGHSDNDSDGSWW
jgi:hypothetical protein